MSDFMTKEVTDKLDELKLVKGGAYSNAVYLLFSMKLFNQIQKEERLITLAANIIGAWATGFAVGEVERELGEKAQDSKLVSESATKLSKELIADTDVLVKIVMDSLPAAMKLHSEGSDTKH